jgi:hypothetical protein
VTKAVSQLEHVFISVSVVVDLDGRVFEAERLGSRKVCAPIAAGQDRPGAVDHCPWPQVAVLFVDYIERRRWWK